MDISGTNNLPLVSIIIINHNYGRYLCETIDSALSQTYERREVIVVDDGSTDDSRHIISGYGSRIVAVLKENGGQGSAFNRGFLSSAGDIVIFLDADDLLSPNAAEFVVKAWRRGISKVQYRLQVIDGQGRLCDSFTPSKKYVMPNGDMIPLVLSKGSYMSPPCSGNAYSRDVLERVLPLPEEDWRLMADVYVEICSVFYGGIVSIEDVLGHYRIHGENNWYSRTLDLKRVQWGLEHDSRRRTLVIETASQFNLKASFSADTLNSYQIIKKLAIAVLSPADIPLKRDITGIVLQGIKVAWSEKDMSVARRVSVIAFLILTPHMPRDISKMLFLWYIYPQNRPSFLQRLL